MLSQVGSVVCLAVGEGLGVGVAVGIGQSQHVKIIAVAALAGAVAIHISKVFTQACKAAVDCGMLNVVQDLFHILLLFFSQLVAFSLGSIVEGIDLDGILYSLVGKHIRPGYLAFGVVVGLVEGFINVQSVHS